MKAMFDAQQVVDVPLVLETDGDNMLEAFICNLGSMGISNHNLDIETIQTTQPELWIQPTDIGDAYQRNDCPKMWRMGAVCSPEVVGD